MFEYLQGLPGGSELEKLVKNYKNAIKSQRRICADPKGLIFIHACITQMAKKSSRM